MAEKTYLYCNVLPHNYQTPYYYIADVPVKVGDIVVVSIRNGDNVKAGLVLSATSYTKLAAPYPVEYTKHILRVFSDEDAKDKTLASQKAHLEKQKAQLISSEEQTAKKAMKENLSDAGFLRKERVRSNKYLQDLIRETTESARSGAVVSELEGDVILSEDGKTVVGYPAQKSKNNVVIRIPSGVEAISDDAFTKVKIKKLVINKELKVLGKCTLDDVGGPIDTYRKDIASIQVEEGSPYFCADNTALYAITEDGTKELLYVLDREIVEYIAPADVSAIADNAFAYCSKIQRVILHEGIKKFDENAFSNMAEIKSIYLPKGVEELIIAPNYSRGFATWNLIKIEIDEKNEHLFIDGDCIYKVLGENEYRLVACRYFGKGAQTIKAGTVEIGDYAFYSCEGFSSIELPNTIRKIGKYAFSGTGLKSITIPGSVEVIEEHAFCNCESLRKACISHELKQIDETVFANCYELKNISSTNNKSFYTLKNGVLSSKNSQSKKEEASDVLRKIAKKLNEWSFSDSASEKAVYDAGDNTIAVYMELNMRTDNATLLSERIDAAETISNGDAVDVKIKSVFSWEVLTKRGKSLGELNILFARQIRSWFNQIEVKAATVTSVTPKSQRRKNAKYALVSVKVILGYRETNPNVDKTFHCRFAYYFDKDETVLVAWIGSSSVKKIVIPAEIDGKRIKKLPAQLFAFDYDIENCYTEEIVVSEGVEDLEGESLYGLEKLKKVVLPKSIKYISRDVFSPIENQGEYSRDLYLNSKIIFVAPSGSYAEKFLRDYKPDCYDCENLTVVNDDSAETQAKASVVKAFDFKRNAGGFAARFRSYLEENEFNEKIVEIPDSFNGQPVISFDISSRPRCVEKLILPASITCLEDIETTIMFYRNPAPVEIEISEDNTAFWSDGKAIYTKDRKTLVRLLAYDLTQYEVAPETEIVEKRAFGDLQNLKMLTLSSNTREIRAEAFSGCSALESIVGLENVTSIDDTALNNDNPYLRNREVLIVGHTLIKCNIPNSKTYIIPEYVEEIFHNAFANNESIEEIVIPDNITSIGYSAFRGATNLRNVKLSNSLSELSWGVFLSCSNLERLEIPASVKQIDISAFPKEAFKEIVVAEGNENYCSVSGMLLSKDKTTLYYVPVGLDIEKVGIPSTVVSIADKAAENNYATKKLELPHGIVTVGNEAFYNASELVDVVMSDTVKTIGEKAFNSCAQLRSVRYSANLEEIGAYAFQNTALTKLSLPEGVVTIGQQAFAETKMSTARLPKSVKTIGWGILTGCKEIEVYDSIDDTAEDCDKGIDMINGTPNSLVGYIGIGHAWAMWACAANHQWWDYTITVRSAQTDEIKYSVWMGADPTQRQYYCFLSSAWGKNATFRFAELDAFFPKIRGTHHKVKVAKLRLQYPVDLNDEMKKKYESYLSKYGKEA